MNYIIEKFNNINKKYNNIPLNFIIILAIIVSFVFGIKAIKYILPFFLGFFLSLGMKPGIEFLNSKLIKSKKISTLIVMVLLYGFLSVILIFLFKQLMHEATNFINNLPALLKLVQDKISLWIEKIIPNRFDNEIIEHQQTINNLISNLNSKLSNLLQTLINKFTPSVASSALSGISKIPHMILFVVMTIMSSYYFASDSKKIHDFFKSKLPSSIIDGIYSFTDSLSFATIQQVKAQILISLTISAALVIGFSIFSIEYAVLVGLVIGFLDVLPIIGAGTFLIPWGLFNLIAGNFTLGGEILFMYIIVIVIRQLVEPKIVGKKLGLYPLISMICMYIGLKAYGFIGLIFGPIIANICKAVLMMKSSKDDTNKKTEASPEVNSTEDKITTTDKVEATK